MTDLDDDLSDWAREVDALIDRQVAELDREIAGLAKELAAAGLDSPEAIRRACDEMDASERDAYARTRAIARRARAAAWPDDLNFRPGMGGSPAG